MAYIIDSEWFRHRFVCRVYARYEQCRVQEMAQGKATSSLLQSIDIRCTCEASLRLYTQECEIIEDILVSIEVIEDGLGPRSYQTTISEGHTELSPRRSRCVN